MYSGWRHRLPWHRRRCAVRRNIGAIPVHNLPRLRTSDINRFNERKWLYVAKERSRRHPAQTIKDVDCADDIELLANTPTQATSLLYSLEQAAGAIGLHMDADKTEYICFNQNGDISTLNSGSLKLVDKFTYLESSLSSTENDINTRLVKAWTAIERLSVIWKFDKMQQSCPYYCIDTSVGRWLSLERKGLWEISQGCLEP